MDMGDQKCGCGKPAERYWHGSAICWECWNWYKLDGPAARHWLEVSNTFLSNVDMYDLTMFLPNSIGLTKEEIEVMLNSAQKLHDKCQSLIDDRVKDNVT